MEKCGNAVFFKDRKLQYKDDLGRCFELVIASPPQYGGMRSSSTPVTPPVPPNLFANALFVDSAYGNDTGATEGSFMDSATNPVSHKYLTIEAAMLYADSGCRSRIT